MGIEKWNGMLKESGELDNFRELLIFICGISVFRNNWNIEKFENSKELRKIIKQ